MRVAGSRGCFARGAGATWGRRAGPRCASPSPPTPASRRPSPTHARCTHTHTHARTHTRTHAHTHTHSHTHARARARAHTHRRLHGAPPDPGYPDPYPIWPSFPLPPPTRLFPSLHIPPPLSSQTSPPPLSSQASLLWPSLTQRCGVRACVCVCARARMCTVQAVSRSFVVRVQSQSTDVVFDVYLAKALAHARTHARRTVV